MTDDIRTTSGGVTDPAVATNDKGGRHVQIVQIDGGGDGTVSEITAGQRGMAGSLPVVVASDQTAIPVSISGAVPVTDNGGALTVDGAVVVSGNVEVTPSSPVANDYLPVRLTDGTSFYNASSGGGGGVTHTDDAPFTPASDDGVPAFAVFDDVAPDSVDEGDAGALRMSANRNLYITLRDAAGNERGANVNPSNALLVAQTGALPAGTNNIGDVDVLTLPALPAGTNNIGDVDVLTLPAIPAGSNEIGRIRYAKPTTSELSEAIVNFSSSGDNTIVSATTSQTTRVYAIFLVASGPTNIKFRNGTTDLTGVIPLTAGGGLVLDNMGDPWFTTSANTAFNINSSAAVQVSGRCYHTKS
jgi:hypothetical protein